MTDDVKGFRDRITAAMERIAAGHSPMRIPADMTDPDIVLSDCLARIDGEAARTAAAVAAAREEQREADARYCPNCLGVGFVERPVPCPYCDDSTHDHYCPTGTQRQQCGCGAERIRATPLTATPLAATPLADELRDEREVSQSLREQLIASEARIAELEAFNRARIEDFDNERMMAVALEAERDALRAQVEAARTYARQALDYGEDCDATDLLAAMDGAKP